VAVEIDLSGKLALVTGGTMGIGESIADVLHNAGANLIVTGVESQESIDELNNSAIQQGIHNIKYLHVDFTDQTSVDQFFKILDQSDKIDICINNAGTNRNNTIENIRDEDYNLLMDVNLKAPFLVTRYLSKRMKQNNYGRIVNIASIWSVKSRERRTVYTMTKAGLVGLTKTSSIELAPYNILVNAVSPGFTLTELTKKTLPELEYRELSNIVPIKRFAEPEEIAKTVLFLVSDLNTYLTGQNVIIDGGFTNV